MRFMSAFSAIILRTCLHGSVMRRFQILFGTLRAPILTLMKGKGTELHE